MQPNTTHLEMGNGDIFEFISGLYTSVIDVMFTLLYFVLFLATK